MKATIPLNDLISGIQPSPTMAASQRAQELKAQGRDVVSFTVGEPDLDTPQHVKDAAIEAMKRGFTKYTAVGGIPALKKTISAKLLRDQGLEYKANEIVVTNGGKHAIAGACGVMLNPGDEVIIAAPYWTSYPDIVNLFGATPVIVPTTPESGYLMQAKDLARAITSRTKMLILNSPSNPTGACYSKAELRALAEVILQSPVCSQIAILSDEVYEYITYGGFQHCSILEAAPELRESTVIVNAFSKAYSMTGWRVGYAAGPAKIIEALTTHQSQFTSNVCSIAQYAAAAAYNDEYRFPKMMAAEFAKRCDLVQQMVAEMPGIKLAVPPRGAFYGFLRIEGLFGKKNGDTVIRSGNDFAKYLLEQYDVVVVQGEAFGDPGAFRMSFATDEEQLKKGLERIHSAAASLN